MKSFAKTIAAIALASASVSALAFPITITNPGPYIDVTGISPQSVVLDLANSDPSYIVGQTTLSSATLNVTFSDATSAGLGGNEDVSVFFGGATTAAKSFNNIVNNGNTVVVPITLDMLALKDLMADGKLVVTFKASLQGNDDAAANYRVESMTLNANAVPEPATLSLMGFALAALGVSRRRKQK